MDYFEYLTNILFSRPNEKDENEYMEHHHLIPKCIGGTNDASNLIWLYPEEHYIAHKLLAELYPSISKFQ